MGCYSYLDQNLRTCPLLRVSILGKKDKRRAELQGLFYKLFGNNLSLPPQGAKAKYPLLGVINTGPSGVGFFISAT